VSSTENGQSGPNEVRYRIWRGGCSHNLAIQCRDLGAGVIRRVLHRPLRRPCGGQIAGHYDLLFWLASAAEPFARLRWAWGSAVGSAPSPACWAAAASAWAIAIASSFISCRFSAARSTSSSDMNGTYSDRKSVAK